MWTSAKSRKWKVESGKRRRLVRLILSSTLAFILPTFLAAKPIRDLPSKTTPVGSDLVLIEDASGVNWKVRMDAITVSGGSVPTQSGNAGKFLTTNGTATSWGAIPFSSLSGAATIAQLPTGATSSTVPLGNDTRFSASITGIRKGAGAGSLDTAASPGSDFMPPPTHLARSANFTVAAVDSGKIYEVTTGASALVVTLPGAATLGNGFACTIRKADAGGGSFLANSTLIGKQGQTLDVWSDGTNIYSRSSADSFDASGNLAFNAPGNISFSPGSTSGVTFPRATFSDPDDPTKKTQEVLSSISTGTLRYNRHPDADTYAVADNQTAPARQWFSTLTSGYLGATPISPNDLTHNVEVLADADKTITNTGAIDTVRLDTAITATRTYTFPPISAYDDGETIDFSSSVDSGNNIARAISASGDTFNGATSIDITGPFFARVFRVNKASGNWTIPTVGATTSGGLVIDTWRAATVSGGVVTIPSLTSVEENHHTAAISANVSVNITGTTGPTRGRIKFRDSTGNHTVTWPATSKTPINGLGLLTTSTGTNIEDEAEWEFDGTNYNARWIGQNYTAAAPPSYSTIADDTTTGLSTDGNKLEGDITGHKFVYARLTANGGVASGTNYTIGKIRLRMRKNSSPVPANGYYCAVFADSGTGAPTATLVGSGSSVVAVSAFNTVEDNVDFAPVATLTSGTTYWIRFYGDVSAADAVNNISWFYHSITGTTGVNLTYSSTNTTGSYNVYGGITTQLKYITYK